MFTANKIWRISLVIALAAMVLASVPLRTRAQAAVEITEIEINQVLGKQLNDEQFYVAGKDTAIRVLLKEATAVDANGKTQTVEVVRDGTSVVTLQPSPSTEPSKALTFLCPSREACGDWQKGAYTFKATINGVSSTRENVTLVERATLRILAVPVKTNFGTETKVPDDRWKTGGEFMRQVYPVSFANFKWELGQELDVTRLDVTTEDGRRGLWEALNGLQPKECAVDAKGPTCYTLIVGFIASQIPLTTGGALQGYTYGAPSNIVVNSDQDMPATVAHEVAHVYGIGDEYKGGAFRCASNPTPADYVGSDWDNRGNAQFKCTSSTAIDFATSGKPGDGSLVKADVFRPFEVGGRGLLGDMISFMGSNAKMADNWTTPEIWSWLFKALAPK
jgi:hypothetical protein